MAVWKEERDERRTARGGRGKERRGEGH